MPEQNLSTDAALTDPLPGSVTVAICTRNRGASISETIRTILANPEDFELLIIDQSDDDETKIAVEHFSADSRLRYERTQTRGIWISRALAVSNARGFHVLFTDDDCSVPVDWVRQMLSAFESDKRIAMVFCNVLPAEYDRSAGFVPTYERPGERLVTSAFGKCRARGIGAGMAVRRDFALGVGSFDPVFGTYFPGIVGEEGDLALRLVLNGFAVFETDRTAVVHDGFRTWAQGRDLTRRNFPGIGLAYSKPIRCGHHSAWAVVLWEGVVVALLQPLRALFRGRRPHLRGFFGFWSGFVRGFRYPVDCRSMNYIDAPRRRARSMT